MEREEINNYLKVPVKKDCLNEDEKTIVSDYFKDLARKRWAKDKRTKEERSAYYRNLVNKRWQKKKGKNEIKIHQRP